ncbi:MAG: PIG-L family deacetylase [Acidimicrobiales bacterium]
MGTLVCFHAHPDDEAIGTGGVMSRAADEGHRVVLVVATRGEQGEVADGFLSPGEELWERRVGETHAAAALLGVNRVEFLDYVDSGMMGEPTNEGPGAFWRADVDAAAGRLADILREEHADVLTHYDDHGGYGHPDHIQVHRVGSRAGALAGTPRVFEATLNRDHFNRLRKAAAEMGDMPAEIADQELDESFGVAEADITAAVDVTPWLDRKRAAMRAHASQIADDHFMLAMPDLAYAMAFGTEWFIRDGQGPGITETDLMAGVP